MIYLERIITIKAGSATINEPIILYKGDKNVEIQFEIKNNPFKTKSGVGITHSQLIIDRKTADSVFSDVERLSNNKVVFVITGDMIDELCECSDYDFQIRLYNDEQSSRATLAPIIKGIQIKEPICEGDEVNSGGADDSSASEGEEVDIFDEEGNYNKTTWESGNTITAQKLNKVEDALDYLVTESKSHAIKTDLKADGSIALGHNLIVDAGAMTKSQCVVGKYNEPNESALFIVGSGTSDSARENTLVVSDGRVETKILSAGQLIIQEDNAPVNAMLTADGLLYLNENYVPEDDRYVPNKKYVDDAINAIEIPEVDLSNYVTKDELGDIESLLGGI